MIWLGNSSFAVHATPGLVVFMQCSQSNDCAANNGLLLADSEDQAVPKGGFGSTCKGGNGVDLEAMEDATFALVTLESN